VVNAPAAKVLGTSARCRPGGVALRHDLMGGPIPRTATTAGAGRVCPPPEVGEEARAQFSSGPGVSSAPGDMEEADKSVLCRTEGHERSAAPPTAPFPPVVRDDRHDGRRFTR
jgi:hypothetical protein